MTSAPNKFDRIVVLVDMDCFYCQVEEQLNPDLRGKPIAVVQYNAWKGGGIIAVNYPARNRGVTRHMRGDEAAEHCPEINLVRVPNVREKADLSKYREAGKQVASVLQTFSPLLERASVDEAYIDITQNVQERLKDMDKGSFTVTPEMLVNTYALGFENVGKFVQSVAIRMRSGAVLDVNDPNNNDVKLLIAATIVTEIRRAVKDQTGYECSAGIAHNKILSKLVCGINKPNKQTVLPITNVDHLYRTLSVKKIQGLGGKFGDTVCESLKITNMVELGQFSLDELQRKFDDKNGLWLHNIARGIDLAPVTPKFTSKSIGCCKKFPGRNAIKGIATLQHWLGELAEEMFDRITQDELENNRKPRQMTVSFMQELHRAEVNSTRSIALTLVDAAQIAADALDVIRRNTAQFFKPGQSSVLNDPILFLGLGVGKFEDTEKGCGAGGNTIMSMFSNKAKRNEELAAAAKAIADSCIDNREPNDEVLITDSPAEEHIQSLNTNVPYNAKEGNRKSSGSRDPTPDPSDASVFLDDTLEETPEPSPGCVEQSQKVLDVQIIDDPVRNLPQKSFFGIKQKNNHLNLSDARLLPDNTVKAGPQTPIIDIKSKSSNSVCTPSTSEESTNDAPQKSFFGIKPKSSDTFKLSIDTGNQLQPQKSFFGIKPKSSMPPCSEPLKQSINLDDSDEETEPQIQSLPQPQISPQRLSSPQPSTSTDQQLPDYKSTYAEYQGLVSTEAPSPLTERCTQCNRKVPIHEMLAHTDAHFAFQLSQEQRLEFRQNENKSIRNESKTVTRQPSAKKPKLNHTTASQSTKSNVSSPSILHKFLIRSDAAPKENFVPDGDPGPMEKCSDCGRMIRIDQLLEHSDYHTAKRLQMELNGPRNVVTSSQPVRTGAASGVKAGSVAAFFKRAA